MSRFRFHSLTFLCLLVWGIGGNCLPLSAQQLDMEFLHQKAAPAQPKPADLIKPLQEMQGKSGPDSAAIHLQTTMKPLTASVSKTLYLPPAMYGQWNVTGTVKETNIDNLVPVASDIWILQREGDAVTVTNPANGASAAVNVQAVEGNTATFHRSGQLGNKLKSETVTLTVNGDFFYGRNLRREEVIRNGKVTRVNYALFDLQGTRIGGTSAVFKPEAMQDGPDIEIEDVRRSPNWR